MVFTTDEPPSGVGGPTYPCQQGEGGKDGPPGHLVQGRPEKVTLCLCQRSVYHSPLCGDRKPRGSCHPLHQWEHRPSQGGERSRARLGLQAEMVPGWEDPAFYRDLRGQTSGLL